MRLVPKMTSNTYTDAHGNTWNATASSSFDSSFAPYNAFDGSASTWWTQGTSDDTPLSSGRELPCWIQIELPKAEVITSYVLRGGKTGEYCKAWTLQGSNDGAAFDDIDTQASSTTLSDLAEHNYSVSLDTAYKFYRLYITDCCNYNGVGAFNLITPSSFDSWEELTSINSDSLDTQFINNTKHDDDSYTVPNSYEWAKYKGASITSFVANGNSWIGFNSSNEHLRVNRRDAAMYNLYSHCGTLKNKHSFFLLRWDGYSRYGSTGGSYRLTYDVIVFDTGDILLNMINIPASDYNGTFIMDGSTYTAPTAENPYVTFYIQEDNTYIAKNELPQGDYLYNIKYLIRDGETYYKENNGALEEITVDTLTAQTFMDSGMNSAPSGDLLKTLDSPQVLKWCDDDTAEINYMATVTATPPVPQTVDRVINLNHNTITGIENVVATVEGSPLFSCSFDGGNTYKAHNGTDWAEVDSGGMSKDQLEAISADQWQSEIDGLKDFIFRFTLQSIDDSVTSVVINFTN